MKRVITLAPAAVLLLLACQDPDGPAAHERSTDPAAAVVSSGLKAPSNASAVALSETRIDISWQDNSQNETGFQVHRSPTGAPGSFALLATTGANATAYSDQGLEPGTQYCYQVRAVRVSGPNTTYSAFSNTACATTPAPPPPPPPPPPAAASGTTAVPSTSSIVSISWTDNSSSEEGFRIDRSIDGGAVWDLASTVGANDSWWGGYALAEQAVCYRVVAFNAGGEAPPSNMACTAPPAGPTNLVATRVDAETVVLTWSDNSAVEDGYQVWLVQGDYCCPGGACNAFDPNAGEWMIAELPPNSTRYSYRTTDSSSACLFLGVFVVAKKDGGYSDRSSTVPLA